MADVVGIGEGEAEMVKSLRSTGNGGTVGHRQRLRERFLSGESSGRTEEALLELLLTYAIPQQDVAPLARTLLAEFSDLAGVLGAAPSRLLKVKGIKGNSAVLLKLVDAIGRIAAGEAFPAPREGDGADGQLSLFDAAETPHTVADAPQASQPARSRLRAERTTVREPQLFFIAVLREAIELLPRLPDSDSLPVVREFLRGALHFNAQQTRQRFANALIQRMFPSGTADRSLRLFARHYAGRQELRDVAFYRYSLAEPLLFLIAADLLVPALSAGHLDRDRLRDYLVSRYPSARSIRDAMKAINQVYVASGIVHVDSDHYTFAYRDILLPSFAFVLHSEFPAPGMYDIAKVEQNRAVRALLWNPDQVLPALYELRNRGVLSKVSEIDSVRQFTTRLTLEQAVEALVAEGSRV